MRRALLALGLATATALVQIAHCRAPRPAPVLDEGPPLAGVPPLAAAATPMSIDELRARVAEVLARERVAGVAIALVDRGGPIWIGGVGVADTQTGEPVGADTVFRAASITKSVVALGVMRLVEQGRLDLDRPLRELLPDVAIDNAWEPTAPVTLAQVLEHTAGLDDMRPNEVFTDDEVMTPRDALAINPRSRVIRWRPGTRMAYSNVGYSLAGRAIEVATGEPFDAWLRREVMLPIGMTDADFHRTDVLAKRLATGYIEPARAARFRPIAHRPAGAMLASATDLARLVQFWLRRGEGAAVVSPAGLARIERTGTLPIPSTDLNYGLGNYGDVGHAAYSRGHDGGLPGFGTTMRYFPELGRGYVILFNATHSFEAFWRVRQLVYAYLVKDRAVPVPSPVPAGPPERPGSEFFAFASPRHALFGFIDRAVLGWSATPTADGVRIDPLVGDGLDLVPARDGAYQVPGHSGSSVRFARDRDGTPIAVLGFAYAEAAPRWPARIGVTALMIALLLLQLAPLYAAAALAIAWFRNKPAGALDLLVWTALAGIVGWSLPSILIEAADSQVLGEVHLWTIALFVGTIVFAVTSAASLISAVRWSVRADRPGFAVRFVPTACALAFAGLAVWLGVNGVIGLRTWAW